MKNFKILYHFRILYINLLWFILVIFCLGCSTKHIEKNDNVFNLGKLYALKILPNTLQRKPQKEIAKVCVSFTPFNKSKQYEILTFENLLKEAYKNTKQHTFTNVGIWQKSFNMILWQKKCLILGI